MMRLQLLFFLFVAVVVLGILACQFVRHRKRRSRTTVFVSKLDVNGTRRPVLQVRHASTKRVSPISTSGPATSRTRTLYTWSKDPPGQSTWKAPNWPLVYVQSGDAVGHGKALRDVVTVGLGPNNTPGMVLVHGYPVYQYVLDTTATSVRGEGIAPSESDIPAGLWRAAAPREDGKRATVPRPGLLTKQCSPSQVKQCSRRMLPTDSLVCVDEGECSLADYSPEAKRPCHKGTPCGFVAPLCRDRQCCGADGMGSVQANGECEPYSERATPAVSGGSSTCRCVRDRFNNRLGKTHRHAHATRHLRRKKKR